MALLTAINLRTFVRDFRKHVLLPSGGARVLFLGRNLVVGEARDNLAVIVTGSHCCCPDTAMVLSNNWSFQHALLPDHSEDEAYVVCIERSHKTLFILAVRMIGYSIL